MVTKQAGEFVIDGQESFLERRLRLVPVGEGNVQLECNGVVLFAFKSGAHVVTTFCPSEAFHKITGLHRYYGGEGRVRLDTDG